MSEAEVKAYSVKVLGGKLAAKGLPVLEDTAEQVIEAVFEWLKESAAISKTQIDDVVSILYPTIEEMIQHDLVDRIDGEDEK